MELSQSVERESWCQRPHRTMSRTIAPGVAAAVRNTARCAGTRPLGGRVARRENSFPASLQTCVAPIAPLTLKGLSPGTEAGRAPRPEFPQAEWPRPLERRARISGTRTRGAARTAESDQEARKAARYRFGRGPVYRVRERAGADARMASARATTCNTAGGSIAPAKLAVKAL